MREMVGLDPYATNVCKLTVATGMRVIGLDPGEITLMEFVVALDSLTVRSVAASAIPDRSHSHSHRNPHPSFASRRPWTRRRRARRRGRRSRQSSTTSDNLEHEDRKLQGVQAIVREHLSAVLRWDKSVLAEVFSNYTK